MGAFSYSLPAIIIFVSVILFVDFGVLETRVDEELDDLGLGWWICKIPKQRFGSGNETDVQSRSTDGSRIFSLDSIIFKSCSSLFSIASPSVKVLCNCIVCTASMGTGHCFRSCSIGPDGNQDVLWLTQ
ncbi:hypothetical protein Droror1_Dr00002713 [Drosera rotundifolia]